MDDKSNVTEPASVRVEVKNQAASYIAAAFGFVAGLAWNDAIKALIEYLFPLSTNTVLAKFAYAIILTVIVVVVTVYLMRVLKRQ
ncbi:MAG: DUF5654 family protein [Patescibacteria group bacterium]